jgi:hypothetical protein
MRSEIIATMIWAFFVLTLAVITANRMSTKFKSERWRAWVGARSRLLGVLWLMLFILGALDGIYLVSRWGP